MDPTVHLLVAQAHNNAWANLRLLRACMQLDHAQFVAKGTSFFPSIKATLNHIVTVDSTMHTRSPMRSATSMRS